MSSTLSNCALASAFSLFAIMLVGVSASEAPRPPSVPPCCTPPTRGIVALVPDFLLFPVFFGVPLELSVDVGFRFDPSRLLCRSILRFVAWKRFLMALGDRRASAAPAP